MEAKDYAMNDLSWKVDVPAFLKEIAENSTCTPYHVTFSILARVLAYLAQRCVEINDPILNIIMLRLHLMRITP